MGNNRVPVPICSTRLGDDWIDDGTLCRTKSVSPGPVGVVVANPAKAGFDSAHGYSLAPEARRKAQSISKSSAATTPRVVTSGSTTRTISRS